MIQRKSLTERVKAQRIRAEQEARRLSDLERRQSAEKKKADDRAKIVLGGMVAAEIENDPDLRGRIVHLLRERVTRPSDKEAVSRWLHSPEG